MSSGDDDDGNVAAEMGLSCGSFIVNSQYHQ